jgi:hypothetical protein
VSLPLPLSLAICKNAAQTPTSSRPSSPLLPLPLLVHCFCPSASSLAYSAAASEEGVAMVRISVLNDALKNMFNAEKRGKRQVLLKPSSKVIIKFLTVMQKHGSIKENPKNLSLAFALFS